MKDNFGREMMMMLDRSPALFILRVILFMRVAYVVSNFEVPDKMKNVI